MINKYNNFNISNAYWPVKLMSLLDCNISSFKHGSPSTLTMDLLRWVQLLVCLFECHHSCPTGIYLSHTFSKTTARPLPLLPIQVPLLAAGVDPCCSERHSPPPTLAVLLQACPLKSDYNIQAPSLSTCPNHIFELHCLLNTTSLLSTSTVVLLSQEQLLICCIFIIYYVLFSDLYSFPVLLFHRI